MRQRAWVVSFFIVGLVSLLTTAGTGSSTKPREAEVPSYFILSVNYEKHDDYGFTYPVTYQFSIPSGSLELEAHKKYAKFAAWIQIAEKISQDFFNGVEAVRFDYDNNKAYVSVAFSAESDEIFLKIADEWGNPVVTYDGITKYYDNRDAAVVFSADDWCGGFFIDSKFQEACHMFTSKKIWLSAAIITQGFSNDRIWGHQPPPIWGHVQNKVDEGYIEVVSHSRTHPFVPYDDYDSEVGGSKSDILDNLDLPAPYSNEAYEYVWGWTAPYGNNSDTLRNKLGEYRYMSDVSGWWDAEYGDFPDWDSGNGLYEEWNRWGYIEFETLSSLNSQFDGRVNAGKIYHIGFHPQKLDFFSGSKIDQHTDYIKGRTNLWYVGHGALMIYHYVKDQNIVTVQEKHGLQTLEEVFSYPNPCYPEQGQVIKITNLPWNVEKVYIYTITGELVRSLERGDEIEEETDHFEAVWDCRNERGQEVARGIYIYLAVTNEGEQKAGKIAIVK